MHRLSRWSERVAGNVFVLPSVVVVLLFAVFPLLVSLYMSLTRFKFVKGGFEFKWVGLANFEKLLVGSEKTHFLGVVASPSPVGWAILALVAGLLVYGLVRYVRSGEVSTAGMIGRIFASVLVGL